VHTDHGDNSDRGCQSGHSAPLVFLLIHYMIMYHVYGVGSSIDDCGSISQRLIQFSETFYGTEAKWVNRRNAAK